MLSAVTSRSERLAKLVTLLHDRSGLSLRAFARTLGVTHTTVGGWKNGKDSLDADSLDAIAQQAGSTRDQLALYLEGTVDLEDYLAGRQIVPLPLVEQSLKNYSAQDLSKLLRLCTEQLVTRLERDDKKNEKIPVKRQLKSGGANISSEKRLYNTPLDLPMRISFEGRQLKRLSNLLNLSLIKSGFPGKPGQAAKNRGLTGFDAAALRFLLQCKEGREISVATQEALAHICYIPTEWSNDEPVALQEWTYQGDIVALLKDIANGSGIEEFQR